MNFVKVIVSLLLMQSFHELLHRKKKLKLVGNERPITINERRKNIPPVATPSQFHTVNQQPNAPVLTSARYAQSNPILFSFILNFLFTSEFDVKLVSFSSKSPKICVAF